MIALTSSLTLLGTYEPVHPATWACPQGPCDIDFGATPTVFTPDGCPTMVAAGNKSGEFYVMRASDLAISGTPLQIMKLNLAFDPLAKGGVGGIPAYWAAGRMLFVTDSGPGINGIPGGVLGLSIAPAPACTLSVAWSVSLPDLGSAQASPTVAGGMVFVGEGSRGRVHAYDAGTGAELWNSGASITGGTFGAPTVAGGKLFVGSWTGFTYSSSGVVRAYSTTVAPPPTCQGTQPITVLGTQTVATGIDSNPLGTAEAFQVTGTGCGNLTSLSLFVDAGSSSTKFIIGLYSDNAGHPGTLLTTSAPVTPVPGQWNTVPVTSTPIAIGTKYWIAEVGVTSGILRFRDTQGGCASETHRPGNLASLPAAWVTDITFPTCPVSGYGSRAP